MKRWMLALTLIAIGLARSADAATLTICANAACTYNGNTAVNVQAALDAANPGDTILLQGSPPATYIGDFIIPAQKSCPAQDATCYITVKTGVTSTGTLMSAGLFPAANVRLTPAYAGNLAKFQQNNNNTPVLRTNYPGETRTNCAAAPCISAFWKFQWIEVQPNSYAGFSLVAFGTNQTAVNLPANNAQDVLSKVPHHFIVDQVYMHGDPIKGMQNGLNLAADQVQVLNSTFKDFKGIGQDTQAIGYANGPGNLTITNNDLQAAGEVFMAGGTDVRLTQTRTATASTTTTVTVNSAPTDITFNNAVACQVGGATVDKWQNATVTGVVGNVITFTPAMTAGCDIPGAVEWNIVPKNGTVTKNHFSKPSEWRNPIVPTPQNVQMATSLTGGTFPAGTYYSRVVAKTTTNQLIVARSTASTEQSVTTIGTTSTVTTTWNPVVGADYYHVFGRSAGGETFRLYLVATDASCVAGTCSVTDTNAATSGACGAETTNGCTQAVPTGIGDVWSVKNIFELKFWDTMTIQGNVFEYNWAQSQSGYAIVLTPVNGDFTRNNYTNIVARITFRDNKVGHTAGGMNITGHDATNGSTLLQHDDLIQNILFYDMGDAWNNGNATPRAIQFTSGNYPTLACPDNITVNHLTLFQSGGGATFQLECSTNNFVIKNSIFPRLFFGSILGSGFAEGNSTWNADTHGTSAWTNNVNAAANCALYPSPGSNFCPSLVAEQNEFVDFAGGNFRLKPTSVYHNAGDDGTDIGANLDTIEAFTNIALNGDNSGGAPPPQPTISTASPLTAATTSTPYSVTLAATSGTPPYTWSVGSGLPTGLTLGSTTGTIAGTASVAGAYSFTVTVTDSLSQVASKVFALTVTQLNLLDDRSDQMFKQRRILFAGSVCPDGTFDRIKVGDPCFDTTAMIWKYALTTSPPVTWVPFGTGASFLQGGNAFGATAVLGTTDAQALQLVTNSVTRVNALSNGNLFLTADAASSMNVDMTIASNATDPYAMGISTANDRKFYVYSLQGTLRQAFGFADASASTDYIFAVSASADSGVTWKPWFRIRQDGALALQNGVSFSAVAPTIASGFGTTPSIVASNGTLAFEVNVGTGAAATSGVLTMPATATTGWICAVNDLTAAAAHVAYNTRQTASTTTSVTVENQTTSTGAAVAWAASDKLRLSCYAY